MPRAALELLRVPLHRRDIRIRVRREETDDAHRPLAAYVAPIGGSITPPWDVLA